MRIIKGFERYTNGRGKCGPVPGMRNRARHEGRRTNREIRMTMPSDSELQRAYRRLLELASREGRERCVPPEAILAVVERSGSEATRLDALEHVMACTACRGELELLRAVAGTRPETTRASRFARSLTPRRLALAASLVMAVGATSIWWAALRPGAAPVTRGADDMVRLVSPEPGGRLGEGIAFVWHSLPESFEYTLEIFDGGGDVLFSASTRDTTFTLPGPLPDVGEGDLRWWVTARMGNGSTKSSAIRPLDPPGR